MILLFFIGCEKKEKIEIALNSWIGYAPLQYILENNSSLNISFTNLVSLMESVKLYQNGLIDGFVGTYEEYKLADDKELVPIILLDKSFGADAIFSNLPLKELNQTKSTVDVYLEIESVNREIFNEFVEIFDLKQINFNLVNLNQLSISNLNLSNLNRASILVSYEPYITNIKKAGFIELSSTKDERFFIFDALFVKKSLLLDNLDEFKRLKQEVDSAIALIQKEPQMVYTKIQKYLNGQSFEEFNATLQYIKWINLDKIIDSQNKFDNNWLIK